MSEASDESVREARSAAARAVAQLARRALERGRDDGTKVLQPGWVQSGEDRPTAIQPHLIQRAILLYDIAVEIDPQGPHHRDRIQGLELMSDFSGAIEAAQRAVACSAQDAAQLASWIPKLEQKRDGVFDPRTDHRKLAQEFVEMFQGHEIAEGMRAVLAAHDEGKIPAPTYADRPGSRQQTFAAPMELRPAPMGDGALDCAERFVDHLIEQRADDAHDMMSDGGCARWPPSRLQTWFHGRFHEGRNWLPLPTRPSRALVRIDQAAWFQGWVTVMVESGGQQLALKVLLTEQPMGYAVEMIEWCR